MCFLVPFLYPSSSRSLSSPCDHEYDDGLPFAKVVMMMILEYYNTSKRIGIRMNIVGSTGKIYFNSGNVM